MCKEKNNNIILYSTIIFPELPFSAILESSLPQNVINNQPCLDSVTLNSAHAERKTKQITLITFWATLQNGGKTITWGEELFNKLLLCYYALYTYGWTPEATWTILLMFLLRCCALIVVVSVQSTEGQGALRFHQKYLNLCSKDERRSYEFGTTRGWVINVSTIFGWTSPFKKSSF